MRYYDFHDVSSSLRSRYFPPRKPQGLFHLKNAIEKDFQNGLSKKMLDFCLLTIPFMLSHLHSSVASTAFWLQQEKLAGTRCFSHRRFHNELSPFLGVRNIAISIVTGQFLPVAGSGKSSLALHIVATAIANLTDVCRCTVRRVLMIRLRISWWSAAMRSRFAFETCIR
jgi:hypothetical protein